MLDLINNNKTWACKETELKNILLYSLEAAIALEKDGGSSIDLTHAIEKLQCSLSSFFDLKINETLTQLNPKLVNKIQDTRLVVDMGCTEKYLKWLDEYTAY